MTRAAAPSRRPSMARQVADAVLYEGYVLYPYRASATKNAYRWQWGVVVPTAQVELAAGEPAEVVAEVPLRTGTQTHVTVTARFLQLCHRQVQDADGAPVDRLEVDGELHLTWDEGHERELSTPPLPVALLLQGAHVQPVRLDAHTATTPLRSGRVVRTFCELVGELEVRAVRVDDDVVRLRAAVRNVTPWSARRVERDEIMRRSLVSTHLLLSALGGEFGSVIDPVPWAVPARQDCHSRGVYPVLAGEDGADDVVLAAPIILEDHPRIAEESPGPSFDALEIDELMALAVQGLTDEEKREARATDPRAAALVDTFGALPPAVMQRLPRHDPRLRSAVGLARAAPGARSRGRRRARRAARRRRGAARAGGRRRHDRRGRRHRPAAAPTSCRRPRPVRGRPPRDRRADRRHGRRAHAARRHPRRGPRDRAAPLVRPLPVLPPRRGRTGYGRERDMSVFVREQQGLLAEQWIVRIVGGVLAATVLAALLGSLDDLKRYVRIRMM